MTLTANPTTKKRHRSSFGMKEEEDERRTVTAEKGE
jgi:hypothetical protein